MATIKEVAARADVSSATVSHVINHTRYVSETVREQVERAMRDLGYRPNALARSLRSGETHTLGLILPDSANPFFAEFGHAIETAAFERGYSIILCNTENDLEKERVYTEVLENKQVDGMVFVASGENRAALSLITQKGLPLVVVDRDMGNLELDTVITDNYQGGFVATQHLLSLGHRLIACITGPSHLTPSAERVTGYRAALLQANIPVDETLILRGDFHASSGYANGLQLLQRLPRPQAIFACNDMMAIGVIRAASQLGLRIPQDISVVGFDNIELGAYITPPLTSVAQPKPAIGQLAINLLLDRIQNPALPRRRNVLPVQLVLRESTGRSL